MIPRLLIANPNTTQSITARMIEVAREVAGNRATIIGATAPFGAPALECQAHLQTAELAVLSMIETHQDCDGVVIAAFGDPGLERARGAGKMPVTGLGEAGILAAGSTGRRFVIITIGPAMTESILQKIEAMGLRQQLAHVEFLDGGVLDIAADPQRFRGQILEKVTQARILWAADAVLLGGAPFSGLSPSLAPEADLPLFDGLTCAVSQLIDLFQKRGKDFG
jgi:allantoin racemase